MAKQKIVQNSVSNNILWALKKIFLISPPMVSVLVVIQILLSGLPFVRNLAFSQLIDSLTSASSSSWVTPFMIFSIVALASALVYLVQDSLMRATDLVIGSNLRQGFIKKVSTLDYQHLENKETASLINKVDDESNWRFRQAFSGANNIFANLISLTAVTIVVLPKFPALWVLIFISQIPRYFIENKWVKTSWRFWEDNREKNHHRWDLNYQLREKKYVSELRINQATNFVFKKFAKIYDFFTNGEIGIYKRRAPDGIMLTVMSGIVDMICIYVLIDSVRNGYISIGMFTFFFQTISQTGNFFHGLVVSITDISQQSYHIENYKKLIELKNNIIDGNVILESKTPPVIEFRNVSFKYPNTDRYIYQNLNLTINTGEELAIVGENGAGKSTLIKLLCRFYDPTQGEIFVNGVDLKKLDLNSWYHQLSYLSQEFNTYYNMTLEDNIAIGKPSIKRNRERVLQSLQKADAHFFRHYKAGLKTFMSQSYGGEEPSWGQWQKIAIARIFYRNSHIMILDEPTSSIDAVSESKIFDNIYQKSSGKTLIIVSHRFSTVRNAKRIIVVEKGKIVEQGTHEGLLKQKGLYAKSFNLQAKGYQLEEKEPI